MLESLSKGYSDDIETRSSCDFIFLLNFLTLLSLSSYFWMSEKWFTCVCLFLLVYSKEKKRKEKKRKEK